MFLPMYLIGLPQLNEELKREALLLVKQDVDFLTKQITITTAGTSNDIFYSLTIFFRNKT